MPQLGSKDNFAPSHLRFPAVPPVYTCASNLQIVLSLLSFWKLLAIVVSMAVKQK